MEGLQLDHGTIFIKVVKKRLVTLNKDLSMHISLCFHTNYWHLRTKQRKQCQFIKKIDL